MTEQTEPADERFPELRELLRAYAAASFTFSDVPGAPSPGFASYARQVANTPERAAKAIGEIDDLLELGLANEEIADEVDTFPLIQPQQGVEESLLTVRELLEQLASGEYVPVDEAPGATWEWEQRFPQLAQLFGADFYPHCLDYSSSHDEILDEYLEALDDTDIQEALDEIADLHTVADLCALPEAFQALGMYVYPPRGMSWSNWLDHVETRLRTR